MNRGPVVVVEMTLKHTTWAWLCAACIARRQAGGWAVKQKDVIAFGCDDCTAAKQAAPGYITPTVDPMPTSPHAFAPGPNWKPDPPMKPWARPAQPRRAQRPLTQEEAA